MTTAPALDNDLITAEEFSAIDTPLDGKYELVRGKVNHMPPPGWRHSEVQGNLIVLLRQFLKTHRIGRAGTEGGALLERFPDTVRGPDVSFYSVERMPLDAEVIGYNDQPPDLVVEILSPNDPVNAMRRKLQDYFSAGVRLAWIVDPEDRTVTIHTEPLASRTLTSDMTLTGGDVLPGFSTPVSAIFE
jgi:Uma2 family endonuclease